MEEQDQLQDQDDSKQHKEKKKRKTLKELKENRRMTLELPVETSILRLIFAVVYLAAGFILMAVFGQFEQTQIPSQYWGTTAVAILITALFIAVTFKFEGEAKRNWRIILGVLIFFLIIAMHQTTCGMPVWTSSRFDPLGIFQFGLAVLIIGALILLFFAITTAFV